VVTKAEEYLHSAEECERKAVETKDPETKRLFNEAADEWRHMAIMAERDG
jgi:hypothetical protein